MTARYLTDVRRLRRRHEGNRTLVYLDQSVLSELVRETERARLLGLLRQLVRDGVAICPQSMGHHDESLLRADLHSALDDLADELSAGISFQFDESFIRWTELAAAAAAFLDEPASRDVWDEAFVDDPQKPLEQLHPPFRVRIPAGREDWMIEEVEAERAKAQLLGPIRERVHEAGLSFGEQVVIEYTALVEGMLEPLLRPADHQRRLYAVAAEILRRQEVSIYAGSAYSRYEAIYMRGAHCESIVDRYPQLSHRLADFVRSEELAAMPALRFPALFHAALATGSQRKPRPSDLQDIAHLTNGLGRCDIVTCDRAMAHLCRERRLIPDGVKLFSTRELGELERELETLASAGTP